MGPNPIWLIQEEEIRMQTHLHRKDTGRRWSSTTAKEGVPQEKLNFLIFGSWTSSSQNYVEIDFFTAPCLWSFVLAALAD